MASEATFGEEIRNLVSRWAEQSELREQAAQRLTTQRDDVWVRLKLAVTVHQPSCELRRDTESGAVLYGKESFCTCPKPCPSCGAKP